MSVTSIVYMLFLLTLHFGVNKQPPLRPPPPPPPLLPGGVLGEISGHRFAIFFKARQYFIDLMVQGALLGVTSIGYMLFLLHFGVTFGFWGWQKCLPRHPPPWGGLYGRFNVAIVRSLLSIGIFHPFEHIYDKFGCCSIRVAVFFLRIDHFLVFLRRFAGFCEKLKNGKKTQNRHSQTKSGSNVQRDLVWCGAVDHLLRTMRERPFLRSSLNENFGV